eukprot:4956992-Pleurochrysis_carterae.AAC.1
MQVRTKAHTTVQLHTSDEYSHSACGQAPCIQLHGGTSPRVHLTLFRVFTWLEWMRSSKSQVEATHVTWQFRIPCRILARNDAPACTDGHQLFVERSVRMLLDRRIYRSD